MLLTMFLFPVINPVIDPVNTVVVVVVVSFIATSCLEIVFNKSQKIDVRILHPSQFLQEPLKTPLPSFSP
jgi:hypothetical protein